MVRLTEMVNQGSKSPDTNHFKQQCRDVFGLGGAWALFDWIEARRELGLLDSPKIEKIANDLQRTAGKVIETQITKALKPKPRKPWEEQMKLINQRETERRQAEQLRFANPVKPVSTSQRMAAAWTRLEQQRRRHLEQLVEQALRQETA